MNKDQRDKFLKELGMYIKSMRSKRGLSSRVLAKKANMSNGGLAGYENTTSIPRLDKFLELMEALDVSITELFSKYEAPSDNKDTLVKALVTEGLHADDVMDTLYYVAFLKLKREAKGKLPCT